MRNELNSDQQALTNQLLKVQSLLADQIQLDEKELVVVTKRLEVDRALLAQLEAE